MEFSYPVPKQDEVVGEFCNKWFHFVSQFQYFHFRQILDGTRKISFLLHFGANTVQEICEIHHLSSDELNRFSLLVEALENKCLFQVVITFFRYLFFNHCCKNGSTMEDFYAELKLLSEMCSFDSVDVDNFNKNHIINSLQEERVRDVLVNNSVNLSANDIIDVCSKVEKHPGASTPELFRSYLFLKNQERKSLQASIKMREDFGMTAFQHIRPEITKSSTLTIISRNDSRYNTDEVQKSDLADNAGKLGSYSQKNLTQMASQADVTSCIPNKTPSLGVNFPNLTEGTSNFIRPSPPVLGRPTSEECSLPPSIALLWPAVTTSQKEESSKAKENKGLEQYLTVTAASTMSSSFVSSIVNTINTAASSILTSENPGTTTPTAAIKVSKCSVGENTIGKHVSINKKPKIKANGVEKEIKKTSENASRIAQAYCSQQEVFLRFRGIGPFVDTYTCRFCIYKCSDKALIEEHALREHKSLKCFVCKACNIKSPSKEQLENHVKTKHMIIEKHKCQICDMVFSCQEELFSHLQDHAKTQAVKCQICDMVFICPEELFSHFQDHAKTQAVKCQICDMVFTCQEELFSHLQDHAKTRAVSYLADNAGKLGSCSKINLTQMAPQADVTSHIPNKTPSLGVNVPSPTEGTSNFIRPSPPVLDRPTSEECSLPPSIALLWPAVTSQKEESSKAKEKKGLEQYLTVTAAPAMSSSVVSSIVNTINTAASSILTSENPGTTTPTAAIKVSKCSVGENIVGKHVSINKKPKIKANGVEKEINKTSENASHIAQAYCSQQEVFLRCRDIGPFVDTYTCRFCIYKCYDKALIEKHALREHKSLKCFVCKACNFISTSKEQLENHVKTKHMIIEKRKCQMCDMVFTCQEELVSHLPDHVKTRAVSCRVCSKFFVTEKFLLRHMAKLHPDIDRWGCHMADHVAKVRKNNDQELPVPPNIVRWTCRACNFGFLRRKLLADHIAKVHKHNGVDKIGRFFCRKCGNNFMDKKSSEKHKRKFHPKNKVKRFSCDLCSYICSNNFLLITHRRIHTGEKPYMCEVCGKRFGNISTFGQHKRVHTGEKS